MEGCFPDFMALDLLENFEFGNPRQFSHFLRSENAGGVFETKASLVGRFDIDGELTLEVSFVSGDLSLPYNVFAVLVADHFKVLFWLDYTRNCVDIPLSLFPGQASAVGKIQLTGTSTLRILMWGR